MTLSSIPDLPASEHVVDPQPNEVTARALYDVARQGPEALRRLPKVRFASDSLLEDREPAPV